ncbi:MAG: hypothetical protein Q7R92_05060 [bacterium]|nr:hypothetical protein [bacterium]
MCTLTAGEGQVVCNSRKTVVEMAEVIKKQAEQLKLRDEIIMSLQAEMAKGCKERKKLNDYILEAINAACEENGGSLRGVRLILERAVSR